MLNYRYNSIHFVADARGTKMPGGNIFGRGRAFLPENGPFRPKETAPGAKCKIPNWNFHLSWFCAIMLFWHLSLPGAQLCGGQGSYKNRNRKEDYPNETQHHHPSVQPGRCRCSGCELHRPDRLRQQRIFCCFQYRFHRCIRCCRRRQLLRRERDLDPGRRHPDHQRHRPYDRLQQQLPAPGRIRPTRSPLWSWKPV